MSAPPVAVLGAGIGGLVAATELRRHGVPVRVFEAGPKVAGLASTHRDDEGFAYDTGAHFITNRLAAAIGVSSQCRQVRRYGEAVWLDGHAVRYPLGLLAVPRFVASATREKLRRHTEARSAADWFVGEYGRRLAEEVAIPLAEAWSGAPAEELSPAVGAKLGGLAHTMYLQVASRVLRRPVASGYSREMPENSSVVHVYPADGVATLCRHLAEGLDESIQLSSPVDRIAVHDGRAVAVYVAGTEVPCRAVISTAPASVLPRLVEGTDVLEDFAQLRFRPMVFVNMRFEGRGLLPDVVTWLPRRTSAAFRLTEAPLSMPWLAPEGKTLITADIGTDVGSEIWTMDDEALGELCLADLAEVVPDAQARYRGCRVVRTPIAYPVFLNAYEPVRQRLAHSTGVPNLLSVGRNGEFAHILMEDVYWRTLARVRGWLRAEGPGGSAQTLERHALSGPVGR